VAAAVASVYYLPNFKDILGYLQYFGFGQGSEHYAGAGTDPFSAVYWTGYLWAIAHKGISYGYSWIFVLALAAYAFSKDRAPPRDYWLTWLWFWVGYLLLSIPLNKGGERYALPILAPLAILTAVHISKTQWRALRYTMVAASIAVGAVIYVDQTWVEHCHSPLRRLSVLGVHLSTPLYGTCVLQHELRTDPSQVWQPTEILRYIAEHHERQTEPERLLLASNYHFLNCNILGMYEKLGELDGSLPARSTCTWLPPFEPVSKEDIEAMIQRHDWLVFKTGFQGPEFANRNAAAVQDLMRSRTPVARFPMNDGSEALLYRLRK
jgi:hypothetical protein